MAAEILDGKKMSESLRKELAERVVRLKEKGVTPGLAVILAGNDPASEIYVRNKGKGCEEIGMYSRTINLPEDTTQEALENEIDKLNADPAIHGILVQLPLPKHLDAGHEARYEAQCRPGDRFRPRCRPSGHRLPQLERRVGDPEW